jgi:hypothetical protein
MSNNVETTAAEVRLKWQEQNLDPDLIERYVTEQVSEYQKLDYVTRGHVLTLCWEMYQANVRGYHNGSALTAFKKGDLRKFMAHADPYTLSGLKVLEVFWQMVASRFVDVQKGI